jgi:hypothetical protein
VLQIRHTVSGPIAPRTRVARRLKGGRANALRPISIVGRALARPVAWSARTVDLKVRPSITPPMLGAAVTPAQARQAMRLDREAEVRGGQFIWQDGRSIGRILLRTIKIWHRLMVRVVNLSRRLAATLQICKTPPSVSPKRLPMLEGGGCPSVIVIRQAQARIRGL